MDVAMNLEDKSAHYTVKTVTKAFELLEVIAENVENPTLPALADMVGLSRNKAYRLLATFSANGLVECEEATGRYRLGIHSVMMAQKIMKSSNIVMYAHPVIEELARKHDEAVYMTVTTGDDVLFLDMVDCEQQIKTESLVGKRFPCFSNAAGKVIKALDSWDLLEKIYRKKGKRGDIPDFTMLEAELREIRNRGVAVDSGGMGEGIITVAVAVRDYAGKAVGAITMLGPSFRMLSDRIEQEIIPSMILEAGRLSEKFGYAPAM